MQISPIRLDSAKNVFQVHGIDAAETVAVGRQLRRGQLMAFFESLSPCLIGVEACAALHHWARELTKLGHEVCLMTGGPPNVARLVGQHRLDGGLLIIAEFVTHDSRLRFRRLNHGSGSAINSPWFAAVPLTL